MLGESVYSTTIECLLERTRFSTDLLENSNDDGIISALSMLDFAETAAQETGICDLGFWAGMVPLESFGDFGKRIASAPTLHSAILTFCSEVSGECSEADYYLTYEGSSAWFCHGPFGSDPSHQSQHELYALMIIIQVIRLALGSNWTPLRICLQSADETSARANHFLSNTNIEFGALITAVEFPLKSLATLLRYPVDQTSKTIESGSVAYAEKFPADPLAALKELIFHYTRQDKQPSIELAAELSGVSKRTLQRFLHSKTTTYSSLIDQVKFEMALPLLRDKKNSITEISFQLGYADPAHFSRAFKRITGLSPSGYRNLLDE